MCKNFTNLDAIYNLQEKIDFIKKREKFYKDIMQSLPDYEEHEIRVVDKDNNPITGGFSPKRTYNSLIDAYKECRLLIEETIKEIEEKEKS